jgi:GT2 family glycosyltransferase/glycosyltransferase involved in cell wall biosynthesis
MEIGNTGVELPNGFERILLRSDGAYAWGKPEKVLAASMYFQGYEYPFEVAKVDGLGRPPALVRLPLKPDSVRAKNSRTGKKADITPLLNKLKDWFVPEQDTLQISIDASSAPLDIQILPRMSLPDQDTPVKIELLAALHHCEADLLLTVHEGLNTIANFDVQLDPKFVGGRTAREYQKITFSLPTNKSNIEISLTAKFHGTDSVGSTKRPFLFFSDPKILPAKKSGATAHDLNFVQRLVPGSHGYFAPAPFSLISPNDSISLLSGDTETRLFRAKSDCISLLEDRGHSLVLSSQVPGIFVVKFGSEIVCTAELGPSPTVVRIPPKFLTGEVVSLRITDNWGLQIFLETYHLTPKVLTSEEVMRKESRYPYPQFLSMQSEYRYSSLKAHLENARDPEVLMQLSWALKILEGGHENTKLTPLVFPSVKKPDVSVIIPAHNKVELTYSALCALVLAYNTATFEVIVVDDASTDETSRLEEIVSGITVVRNKTPQRFIRACNAGVEKARGKFIALLNNDTEPAYGWLDELIDAFGRFDQVGLVGSKLLYPDGKLQEAGGIVWGDGSPWNYGKGQNPWEPRFNYSRQVDYVSGAAMMTTRDVWNELGGLSQYLEPMYFEDTDFAFKVREAGYKTYYIPSSVVYHYEGMTSGTDLKSGLKKQQLVNASKFKKKWAKSLTTHGDIGIQPDLEKDRGVLGRVLFIDYATPRIDRDAGSYAAIQEIRLVQSLGYKVTFIALNLSHLGSYTSDLEKMGVEVITAPFALSVQGFLNSHGSEFDFFYVTRFHVAKEVFKTIRKVAPLSKVLFNNADLHFLRELRMAKSKNDPKLLKLAKSTRKEELKIIQKADVVLSYNTHEHAVIESHTDKKVSIVTAPWVVDVVDEVPPIDQRSGISFLGSFAHHPNPEGVLWFAKEVVPLLDPSQQDSHLFVYGSGMTEEIKNLEGPGISTPGYVDNLADAYHRHKVFVAPLLSGAGIKGKVLSAIAHGVPTILSPIAAEGIGLRHGHDCLITSEPSEWVDLIQNICTNSILWDSISRNGRDFISDQFSFKSGVLQMRKAFEAL